MISTQCAVNVSCVHGHGQVFQTMLMSALFGFALLDNVVTLLFF